jgi:hypothetical protein
MKTIEINGKQYQEYSVVMLPTENMTGIVLHGTGIDPYYDTNTNAGMFDALNAVQNIGGICQHLYFISDEKIVKEDWVYDEYNNKIYQATDIVIHNMKSLDYEPFLKKIIATTDETLSVVKERAGDNVWTQQLPQIPQQFVKYFIESYNAGNKISKVLVEVECPQCLDWGFVSQCKNDCNQKFVQIKLTKDNKVSVLIEQSPVEAMNDKSTTQQLINSLKECLGWMESLRVSGDAGNWDWEDDEYTRAQELLNRIKN